MFTTSHFRQIIVHLKKQLYLYINFKLLLRATITSIPTSKETICYAFLLINSFKSHTQGNSAYYFVQNKYQIWGLFQEYAPQLSKSIVLVVNSAINLKVEQLCV